MFTLPNLPYEYDSLEPFIDEETMHFHHDKHHAAYVKNLNDLLAGHEDLLNMDVNDLLQNLGKAPDNIRQKVKNNAGGVANHNMFWEIMCPSSNSKMSSDDHSFYKKLYVDMGSFSGFQEEFKHWATQLFGSGWTWLVFDPDLDKLDIVNTSNQDSPVSEGKIPLLALDLWEHAYYLKFKNVRADYIDAWWNVVNWKEVEKRFEEVSRK